MEAQKKQWGGGQSLAGLEARGVGVSELKKKTTLFSFASCHCSLFLAVNKITHYNVLW